MKTLFLLVSLLAISVLVMAQEDSINASLAKNYIGQKKMICGEITQARLKNISKDEPSILFTGPDYENRTLALVFTKRVLRRFPFNPNLKMINHKFCVKGKIKLYEGRPAIFIKGDEQLNVED